MIEVRTGKPKLVYEATTNERETLVVAGVEDFDSFYLREYRHMVGLARGMCRDGWVAEDIAQEAMLRAHRRWNTVSRYERPGAWVRRVTINLATSRLRRRVIEMKTITRLGRRRSDLREQLSESDEELWAEVRALPRRQREAVALHYIDDLPISEVAAVLGVAETTVKTHLERGRQNLAMALKSGAIR